ncbi:hypothetical protein NP493_315g00001 [Ridgeia piscesae]|uniref:E3 ubiquitin-protein ligase Topors n=1 Tax=Ridgeia piscesae TaxID=27915 RepID=A0AAD9L4Y9_RIDPI|nr:hypothetical protein NP493_315g00001 [Ridgeia piscesae]
MKKRPKPSDGNNRAELVVPKKRKSARLLASKDSDKQMTAGESTDAVADASKGTTGTSKDADSSSSDSSPNNNCSICLGQLENKSFTDSCFHTFCFVCLLEWSKVKAVCPLCKQPFKSIIHNVRSIEDYDQYYLRSDELTSDASRRFRYRTTLMPGAQRRQAQEHHHRMLLQRPSRATLRGPFGRTGQAATSEFRQRVYATGMRVKELVPTDGRPPRYRDISAAFFSRNPASTHRLVPWLNRELNVLLNHHDDHIQFVLELILDLIKRYDIRSEEFFQHIQPFTGRRTEHFVHEFYSFARAPYDIVAYDQNASYDNVDLPVHEIESDDDTMNDNDDDSDVIMVSPPPGESASVDMGLMSLTPLLDRVRNFLGTFSQHADTAHTGWDTPIPGTSQSWSPQYTATGPDDPIDITDSTTRQTTNGTPVSSAASDVEIVAVEKPWECRTPICLSSDSDCGVTVPAQFHEKQRRRDTHRRSRSLSSTRSGRTGHSSHRRRSRSSSSMRMRDVRNRDRHHRRHLESSRRRTRSADRRDRRRDRDRSSSSRRRHHDSHRERYRIDGHGRLHRSSGRRSERRSSERHGSRSHIYVDSDSSHSTHRHKRRHKDRHDRGDRHDRRGRGDDEVLVTRVRPPYKRTMDGDASNDISSDRHYKKHPTGHKHSKSANKASDNGKLHAKVKKESDTTAVLKSVVAQPCDVGESVFVPVAIREEPQNDGYADHQEPSTSDARNTVTREETRPVDKNQQPGTSIAIRNEIVGEVDKNQVSDAQPSTSELVSHKECPTTEKSAETEPSTEPGDGNDAANCTYVHNVDRENGNHTVPLTETGRDVDMSAIVMSSEMASNDDRVDVGSEESSPVDVESIDPPMSSCYPQVNTATKCLSVSDDEDIEVVDTGSGNDGSVMGQSYSGGQIEVTSGSSTSSDSNSNDSSSGKDHLSIDITSPDKENRSVGSSTEQCISITDDDDDDGQNSSTKTSQINAGSGRICQRVVSVSDDDNSAHQNIQSDTTESGDFYMSSDEEKMVEARHQLQQLRAALAANSNMSDGGTPSTGLVEKLKHLLPKKRHKMATTEHEQSAAGSIRDGNLTDNPPKQYPSVVGGDDVLNMEAGDGSGVRSSDTRDQKMAELSTNEIIQETSLSGKSLQQCPSVTENDKVSPLVLLNDKGRRSNIRHGDLSEVVGHIKEPTPTVLMNGSVQTNKSGIANKPADTNSNFEQLSNLGIAREITGANSEQVKVSGTRETDEIPLQDATTDDDDNDEFAELYLENMLDMNK